MYTNVVFINVGPAQYLAQIHIQQKHTFYFHSHSPLELRYSKFEQDLIIEANPRKRTLFVPGL